VEPLDPFDLPEWLGTQSVTWTATSRLESGPTLAGHLTSIDVELACDLLAADTAYPAPVVSEDLRQRAHRDWSHGEMALVHRSDRLTGLVPGTTFTPDLVLEAIGRLARAVGAPTANFHVSLRL
jgi:hypothetical protein